MQLEQSVQPTQPLVPHPPEERSLLAPKDTPQKKPVPLSTKTYDKFLLEICDRIDREVDERAEVRARRYTRNHNYWWGGERRWQYWTKEGYKSLDRKQVKRLFSNNQFFYQVRTILAVVTRSHPRLNVSPAPAASDNDEKVSGAKVATRTLRHDQREKLSAEFMVREWMDKLLCGFAVRGQWYAKEGSTAKTRVPIVEQRPQQLPGAYVCSGCGMTGPDAYAQDGQCPHCQSPVDIFPGESVSVPVHAGYEEIQDGDALTYGISPYEFDLAPEARDVPSSPYARWQRKVRKTKLKRAYSKVDVDRLPSTNLPVMLQAQEAVQHGRRVEAKGAFTVLKTYWISPDEYFEFASGQPATTLGGIEIPAGTVLSDAYPQGARVDVCGGKLIDLRGEVKEDCLSYSPFHMDNLSWEGKGLDDAAELQRWIDDIHTLYLQIQLREALGISLYDKEMFNQGKYTGEIGAPVGVDVPQDNSGRTAKDAVSFVTGNQPHQSIFTGLEYVQQSQTNVTGAFPSLSGSNMEGSETARGRIILREQSLQGLGPQLFLAARHDVVWAKQNLKLKKQYWTSERFVPYLEEGEPLGGRWFSASDLETDFVIDVEADSWMPLTRMDEIDNITTYMGGETAMGGIPGGFSNTQIVPKAIGRKAAELLNVPKGTDPEEKDLRAARHRYAILKQAVETATEQGSMPDDKMDEAVPEEMNSPLLVPPQVAMPFATMPSVRPLPDVDNHAVFVEFYKDAIKDAVDSDGIENHPLTKATLMLLIKAHERQGVFDTQEQGVMAVQAQAPMVMAQNAVDEQKAQGEHQRDTEKSQTAHRQGLEKQAQGSKLKRDEIKTKGETDSLLNQVKVK